MVERGAKKARHLFHQQVARLVGQTLMSELRDVRSGHVAHAASSRHCSALSRVRLKSSYISASLIVLMSRSVRSPHCPLAGGVKWVAQRPGPGAQCRLLDLSG